MKKVSPHACCTPSLMLNAPPPFSDLLSQHPWFVYLHACWDLQEQEQVTINQVVVQPLPCHSCCICILLIWVRLQPAGMESPHQLLMVPQGQTSCPPPQNRCGRESEATANSRGWKRLARSVKLLVSAVLASASSWPPHHLVLLSCLLLPLVVVVAHQHPWEISSGSATNWGG